MFYTYSQNNSGGEYEHVANAISHYVVIEADSVDEADERAEDIGLYFDGAENGIDCSCCGSRWYSAEWGEEGTEMPSVYGKNVDAEIPDDMLKWIDGPEGYIHFKDGTVSPFWP